MVGLPPAAAAAVVAARVILCAHPTPNTVAPLQQRLYDVNTTIVDAAISAEHAVGFAHTLTQL